MKWTLLVVLCVLVAGALARNWVSEEQQFRNWMKIHNKQYASDAEYSQKFGIFKANLRRYAKLNEKDDTVVHGPTKFSDMTHEEFVDTMLMKNFTSWKNMNIRDAPPKRPTPPGGYPSSYSWVSKGATTPVYNQGQCGSCWAFSTTESIESMTTLAGQSLLSLSMQQIVDCDTSDDGCGGGDPPTAYQYVISAGGLEAYSSYPYTGQDGYCAFSASKIARKISSWQWVTQSEDESAMQAFTYSDGPPSVCVDASSWDSYNGGVYTSSNCGTQLDHCVQIVGWAVESGMNAWVVRNSWGTDWGYGGYLYVAMGQDACGIAQECTSAVA
jgi:cathepsin F